MANTEPSTQATLSSGEIGRERVRGILLGKLGDVRDTVSRDCSDEIYAQRLGVLRQAVDVAVAAVDALYSTAGRSPEQNRLIGVKAGKEAAGESVEDVNVAVRTGSKDGVADLPDPDEIELRDVNDPNPVAEAAPGNMTTDPEANPRLKS